MCSTIKIVTITANTFCCLQYHYRLINKIKNLYFINISLCLQSIKQSSILFYILCLNMFCIVYLQTPTHK